MVQDKTIFKSNSKQLLKKTVLIRNSMVVQQCNPSCLGESVFHVTSVSTQNTSCFKYEKLTTYLLGWDERGGSVV